MAQVVEHPEAGVDAGVVEGLAHVAGSLWACYRFTTKLRANKPLTSDCLDRVVASLRSELPDYGRSVAIDASDLPAYANGQRYVFRNGPQRERFSDPDASWGHRSAVSTRKGGGFYGYKLHAAVCANTDLPIAWRVETARRHESLFVAPLLDATRARGLQPATCAMDKGYDNNRVSGCVPIVSLRKGRPIPLNPIPYGSAGCLPCLGLRGR